MSRGCGRDRHADAVRPPRRCGGARDRGAATVWATVVAAVLVAVFGGVLLLGQAVVARHRAGAAADLGALAAAVSWADGPEAACAAARRVAAAQGAVLAACRVGGEVAEVRAGVRAGPFTAEVTARAGPPLEAAPRAGPAVGVAARAGSSSGVGASVGAVVAAPASGPVRGRWRGGG
ncbi:Rv3654c family TadE-like protein [Streptomyces sp. NPDC048352]|uniref:Rv3654c family TadE-like protein n=1 Tax=Streptomyces sp. NPDC048352 TaxID=3154718 RepID=UPI0034449360